LYLPPSLCNHAYLVRLYSEIIDYKRCIIGEEYGYDESHVIQMLILLFLHLVSLLYLHMSSYVIRLLLHYKPPHFFTFSFYYIINLLISSHSPFYLHSDIFNKIFNYLIFLSTTMFLNDFHTKYCVSM